MVNYQNSKIYKITDVSYTKCYIGSTCKKLCQRMSGHRSRYRAWKDGKETGMTSFILFEEFGVENCKIELVENYPCNSKEELHKREGEHIKNILCVNKINPNNKNDAEYHKQYRIDNADKIKQYKMDNKEHIKLLLHEYHQENKEAISEYKKQYRLENMEKIKHYKIANMERILGSYKRYNEYRKFKKNPDEVINEWKRHVEEVNDRIAYMNIIASLFPDKL